MISDRKYQGLSSFRFFTRWVKSVKQAKFRLPDIQPVYLKKTAQFRCKFDTLSPRVSSIAAGAFSASVRILGYE